MRHRVRTRRLGVRTSHRKAMMRNMVTSLMEHGRIVTTITRAKELRRLADRMVTLGKDGSLHARRQALSVIRDRHVVAKLFEEWGPMFADRTGGYTRIVRLGRRRGDATMMAVIELAVDSLKPGKKKGQKLTPSVTAASVIPEASAASEDTASADTDSTTEVSAKAPDESTGEESPEKSAEPKEAAGSEAGDGVQPISDVSDDDEVETAAASQTSAGQEKAGDASGVTAGEDAQVADDSREQVTSDAEDTEDTKEEKKE